MAANSCSGTNMDHAACPKVPHGYKQKLAQAKAAPPAPASGLPTMHPSVSKTGIASQIASFQIKTSGGTRSAPVTAVSRDWSVPIDTRGATPVKPPTPYTPHPTPAGRGSNWQGMNDPYPWDPWTTQQLSLHPTPAHHIQALYRPSDLTSFDTDPDQIYGHGTEVIEKGVLRSNTYLPAGVSAVPGVYEVPG